MTDNYVPKIGDKVRRTEYNGTVHEGVIQGFGKGYASDGNVTLLWMEGTPGQTELLHRPVEFKTAIGTCYRHPVDRGQAMVRVDQDRDPWLGHNWNEGGIHWFTDVEVRDLVENKGWIEHPLTERKEA